MLHSLRSFPQRWSSSSALLAIVVATLLLAFPLPVQTTRAEESGGANEVARVVEKLLESVPAPTIDDERALFDRVAPHAEEAIVAIAKRLSAGDAKRSAIEYALAGLATHSGRPGSDSERAAVEAGLLRAIEGTEEAGDRALLISILEQVAGPRSVQTLAQFVADGDLGDRAIRGLVAVGTDEAAQALHDALPKTWGRIRVELIYALGRLGREEAARDIVDLATAEDADTRHAAWKALAALATPEAAAALSSLLETARVAPSVAERAAAHSALLALAKRLAETGERARAGAICRSLIDGGANGDDGTSSKTPPHIRCAALDTLVRVLGDAAFPEVFAAVRDGGAELRATALRLAVDLDAPESERASGEPAREGSTRRFAELLAKTDDAELAAGVITLLGRRGDPTAKSALRHAWESENPAIRLAAIRASADLEGRPATPLWLAAVEESSGSTRAALLASANDIGGGDVLRVLAREIGSKDASVREAAAQALTDWKDPNALDIVFQAFRSTSDDALRLRLLDSYVDLVRGARFARPRVLALWHDALAAARTPAEKRRMIDAFGGLKMLASLETLAEFFDDEGLATDAARAAIQAALPRKSGEGGLRGYRVVELVEKALERTTDRELEKRAREYIDSLPPVDRLNLAEHRPVRASVPYQDDHWPELAVDGDPVSEDSAWFGARWPGSLEVDLEDSHTLGGASVVFWHGDGRVYQYRIEVSADREHWTTVVDRTGSDSATTAAGFDHRFSPTDARWVRLTVTHNSANEAVHVLELKVYAAGKLPERFGG